MLREEAAWLVGVFQRLGPDRLSPMLNVGSESQRYRTRQQPWAGDALEAFSRAGGIVVHTDLQSGPGIDLDGDITDPRFRELLGTVGPRSVLCTNLLQYIDDPSEVCRGLAELVPEAGYLILSVPHHYPYHVDTGFRPTAVELASMVPGTEAELLEQLRCGSFGRDLAHDPFAAMLWLGRVLLPFYRYSGWRTAVARIPWLLRRYEISCVVLRKASVGDTGG